MWLCEVWHVWNVKALLREAGLKDVTWINPAEYMAYCRALVLKKRVHFLDCFMNRQVAIGFSRTPPPGVYFAHNPEREMVSWTLEASRIRRRIIW
jgi:hypothetical protein